MIKITASIVIYNEDIPTLERIINNFLSLSCQAKELVVVDNSPEALSSTSLQRLGDVKYIFNNKNVGFGAGHNIAFTHRSLMSNIHLIINPDIYFYAEEMDNFLKWFYSSNSVVLALPNILNLDGSLQPVVRDIPSPLALLKRKLGLNAGDIVIAKNSITEIPFAHGCFMAFKTDVFKKIGGFDERFFLYMEDIDIWIRAKEYGKTVMNTNFDIFHEFRKGSSKNLKLFWHHMQSAIIFFTSPPLLKEPL